MVGDQQGKDKLCSSEQTLQNKHFKVLEIISRSNEQAERSA